MTTNSASSDDDAREDALPPPRNVANWILDKQKAPACFQAITAALYARVMGRGGQHVKVNMLRAAVAFLWPDGGDKFLVPLESRDDGECVEDVQWGITTMELVLACGERP